MEKEKLYNRCLEMLDSKIEQAERMMKTARESANSDTKSSAGDKFETGREMAMQEVNKAHTQKQQALEMQFALNKININLSSEKIQIGSLVYTNKGTFFISISLGIVPLDNTNYFVISGNSPIGAKIIGLAKGDSVEFNGNSYLIERVG